MIVDTQNEIAGTLRSPSGIEAVQRVTAERSCSGRWEVARRVCESFDFRNRRGELQISSCLTSLRRLEKNGCVRLPPSRNSGGWKRSPQGCEQAPGAPVNVPDKAGDISELRLQLVQNKQDLHRWNELLLQEHPQGDRIITGRQLRYFIVSEHGVLGAIGVSSAALHLQTRDEWIGWQWDRRRKYLERIICLSRFLIRPSVCCRNLASKVLGFFAGRISQDFESIYGYRPWLIESFVDPAYHTGASYRAANWTFVGMTKGRGRNDSAGTCSEPRRQVYLYCLEPDFRQTMGLPSDAGAVALEPGQGLDGEQWIQKEFGEAPLGDKRLSRRLVSIAEQQAWDSESRHLQCTNGKTAEMQGYYRFIEHPDREAVNSEAILEPHRQRTVKRMRNEKRVLCAQDSTILEFSSLKDRTEGLGPTGTNSTKAEGRGLRLHCTMAVSVEGLPLGILASECEPRQFYPDQSEQQRRSIPFEQKEGYRWLSSIKACEEAAKQLPNTRLINVMDREGDIFELFDHWYHHGSVDLLVRAAIDRKSDIDESLFQEIRNSAPKGRIRIDIPDRRDKKRRRTTPHADLEIRYKSVNIQCPKHKTHLNADPVPLYAIYAYEPEPPSKTKPIEWILFSTEPIDSLEKAQQAIKEYARRWRIEEWHKVLKSGCKIEDTIADDAEAIRRVVAINLVIAWRVMLMTLLGRQQPDQQPEVLFSDVEIQVLTRVAEHEGFRRLKSLGDAVIILARLGGYRERKNDHPPGTVVLWRGLRKLENMVFGAGLFIDNAHYDPG